MLLPYSSRPVQTNRVTKKQLAVASYHDPYYKYYRRTTRVLLAYVLPTLVIIVLLFLVIGFVSDNLITQPAPTETYIFNSVPVPANSLAAPFDAGSEAYKTIGIEKAWLPNYHGDNGKTQAFLVNVPQGEPIAWTNNYYQQRLLKTKRWQMPKSVTYEGKVAVLPSDPSQAMTIVQKPTQGQQLYVQGINANGQAITGLFVDFRLLTARELKDNPGEYGSQAKDGQIYLVITKNILYRDF